MSTKCATWEVQCESCETDLVGFLERRKEIVSGSINIKRSTDPQTKIPQLTVITFESCASNLRHLNALRLELRKRFGNILVVAHNSEDLKRKAMARGLSI